MIKQKNSLAGSLLGVHPTYRTLSIITTKDEGRWPVRGTRRRGGRSRRPCGGPTGRRPPSCGCPSTRPSPGHWAAASWGAATQRTGRRRRLVTTVCFLVCGVIEFLQEIGAPNDRQTRKTSPLQSGGSQEKPREGQAAVEERSAVKERRSRREVCGGNDGMSSKKGFFESFDKV